MGENPHPRKSGAAEPIQHLMPPPNGERVETGNVQFGDDWTGVFLRRDHAFPYALALLDLINHARHNPDVSMSLLLASNTASGLLETLVDCIENPRVREGVMAQIKTVGPSELKQLLAAAASAQQPMSDVLARGSTQPMRVADERMPARMTERWKLLIGRSMTGWYPSAVPWDHDLRPSEKAAGCKIIEPPDDVSRMEPAQVIQWGYDHKELWFKGGREMSEPAAPGGGSTTPSTPS